MRSTLLIVSIYLSLFNFLTVSHAKDMPDFGMKNGRSEEGIIKVDLPLPIVEKELRELLLKKGSQITEISNFKIDPIKRSVFIDGKLDLPDSILLTMEEKA